MIDMIRTRESFNALGKAAKDEDYLKWRNDNLSDLEQRYMDYRDEFNPELIGDANSFDDWCLMRYLEFVEESDLEMIAKPILLMDEGTFRDWYYDGEPCMCGDFMEGGTVQSHFEGVGYLRFDQILNIDEIKPLLSDGEIKAEEIESPGEQFQMVFQEYEFKLKVE